MSRARKESAFHLALLVLVQWISLAVVILNGTALHLLDGTSGVVHSPSTPADYMLLILGVLSFIGSTIILLLHFYLYYRLNFNEEQLIFSPPKSISAAEVILSVAFIVLWTVTTSIILSQTEDSDSPCRSPEAIDRATIVQLVNVCELFDTTILLAYLAVGSWVLILLVTLFILIRSPDPPTAIFTIETPEQFSQQMLVSLPTDYPEDPRAPLKPYYLGHHTSRITPVDIPQLTITAPSTYEASSSTDHPLLIEDEKIDNPYTYGHSSSYSNNSEQIQMLEDVLIQHNDEHVSLSSPSNIGSSVTTDSSTSYYSSRQIPHGESQRTFQSLSTLDSIYRYQPIHFELPMIQLGISLMDDSFIRQT
ncbi:hypothetical protein BDB01DRAFT_849042 [Pilobolus umbonatus]|nr:hypothetical protein BDB01DRAFT_849042 [Pilobolus umbonatus]